MAAWLPEAPLPFKTPSPEVDKPAAASALESVLADAVVVAAALAAGVPVGTVGGTVVVPRPVVGTTQPHWRHPLAPGVWV